MQLISLEIRILICYKMIWIKLINYWKFRCLRRMLSKRVKLKIWSFCFFIILRKTDDCKEFFLEFLDLSSLIWVSWFLLVPLSSFVFLTWVFAEVTVYHFAEKKLVKGNEFLIFDYGITTDLSGITGRGSLVWMASAAYTD